MGALVDIAAQGRLSAHRTSILTVAGQSKNALKYILTLWVLTMQTPVCYRCTQAETCRGGGGEQISNVPTRRRHVMCQAH